jgi:hypothetical protein
MANNPNKAGHRTRNAPPIEGLDPDVASAICAAPFSSSKIRQHGANCYCTCSIKLLFEPLEISSPSMMAASHN